MQIAFVVLIGICLVAIGYTVYKDRGNDMPGDDATRRILVGVIMVMFLALAAHVALSMIR